MFYPNRYTHKYLKSLAYFIYEFSCNECPFYHPNAMNFHHINGKTYIQKKLITWISGKANGNPMREEKSLDVYRSIYEFGAQRTDLLLLCLNHHAMIHSS